MRQSLKILYTLREADWLQLMALLLTQHKDTSHNTLTAIQLVCSNYVMLPNPVLTLIRTMFPGKMVSYPDFFQRMVFPCWRQSRTQTLSSHGGGYLLDGLVPRLFLLMEVVPC